MQKYHYYDDPITVFGVPFFEERRASGDTSLRRLPDSLINELPSLDFLGRRCPGGRLAFRCDAEEFTLNITLSTMNVDIGMSIYGCQSAQVCVGNRDDLHYIGLVSPSNYGEKSFSGTLKKSSRMEDVTVYLPRDEIIADIELFFPDGTSIERPSQYCGKPFVAYGSSITEGGCSCNLFSAYPAILSNRLNIDYYNLGFSGSAKGELAMANYICTFDMSAFIYDYDHNAPTPEHLEATHELFFLQIREKKPALPVIMMSKPAGVYTDSEKKRRDIIRRTYENALLRGDTNVYFIDGETFYGERERHLCSIDNCHPNDIGFLRMADVIEPVLRKALNL